MTISLCTFLRAVSYGLLLPFYVCGTELRRSLQRQGLQPVVLVLALTVILQREQTFATLGGQYVGIVCSIALYAITAYALLRRSIGLALQQALCFFLLTDCTDTIMRFANMRLLGYDPLRSGTFWAALLAYLPLTTVQGTLLWLLRSFCPAEKLRILRSAALALYVLAAVPYLFVCRLTYWLPLTNEELTTAVPVLLTGCCVLALLVNISFLSYAIAEEEKRTMLQLRIAAEQQQQQYLLRKTAVDSVRRKYHDLKNILLYLEQSSDQATVQAHIRQILQEVQPYEQMTATGNETVDILLGEKLARCQQAQIACTITVDGKLLNFIQPIDLCVIFGNAMDNAIEACLKLEEAKRRIEVSVLRDEAYADGDAKLYVSIINTSLPVHIEKDCIATTKLEPHLHGFGLPCAKELLRRNNAFYTMDYHDGAFQFCFEWPDVARNSCVHA